MLTLKLRKGSQKDDKYTLSNMMSNTSVGLFFGTPIFFMLGAHLDVLGIIKVPSDGHLEATVFGFCLWASFVLLFSSIALGIFESTPPSERTVAWFVKSCSNSTSYTIKSAILIIGWVMMTVLAIASLFLLLGVFNTYNVLIISCFFLSVCTFIAGILFVFYLMVRKSETNTFDISKPASPNRRDSS